MVFKFVLRFVMLTYDFFLLTFISVFVMLTYDFHHAHAWYSISFVMLTYDIHHAHAWYSMISSCLRMTFIMLTHGIQ
jgi:hypothetical protein